jgi:hypothetical protein
MVKHNAFLLWATAFCCPALHAQANPFSADVRQTYAMTKDSVLKAADMMPSA